MSAMSGATGAAAATATSSTNVLPTATPVPNQQMASFLAIDFTAQTAFGQTGAALVAHSQAFEKGAKHVNSGTAATTATAAGAGAGGTATAPAAATAGAGAGAGASATPQVEEETVYLDQIVFANPGKQRLCIPHVGNSYVIVAKIYDRRETLTKIGAAHMSVGEYGDDDNGMKLLMNRIEKEDIRWESIRISIFANCSEAKNIAKVIRQHINGSNVSIDFKLLNPFEITEELFNEYSAQLEFFEFDVMVSEKGVVTYKSDKPLQPINEATLKAMQLGNTNLQLPASSATNPNLFGTAAAGKKVHALAKK